MPSRIIREGILTSRAVNALSDDAEILYRRLMSIVDDYGRFEDDIDIIRARCFALKLEQWTCKRIADALQMLGKCSAGVVLVTRYSVDGRKYLQINNFNQKTRSKPKFPEPSDLQVQDNCPASAHVVGVGDVYSESESESESESGAAPPDPLEAKRPHGEFGHVMLTLDEFGKLHELMGPHLSDFIERFDAWVHENPNAKTSSGKRKNRNPYLTIRQWFNRDKNEGKLPKVKHGFSEDPNTDAVAAALAELHRHRDVAQEVRRALPDVPRDPDEGEGPDLLRGSLGPEPF